MASGDHVCVGLQSLRDAGWQAAWLLPLPAEAGLRSGLVVKCGGSLLGRPDWPRLLGDLLAACEVPVQLMIGGGAVVDGLRQLDAACPQPAARMHRLAIAAMMVTARMVAEELRLPMLSEQASAIGEQGVLTPTDWLASGRFDHLPASWSVTSDSLAAAVAAATLQPLLLVKSVPPPSDAGLTQLAQASWIDQHFPQIAGLLPGLAWAVPPQGM